MKQMLIHAWAVLIALSAGSTAIALLRPAGGGWAVRAAGIAILAIAAIKAHMILARYLGLAQAPQKLRGFDLVLGLFGLIAAGLYLAA